MSYNNIVLNSILKMDAVFFLEKLAGIKNNMYFCIGKRKIAQ